MGSAATSQDAAPPRPQPKTAERPFTLAEIIGEPESRRRTLLAFLPSRSMPVGRRAISGFRRSRRSSPRRKARPILSS